MIELGLTEKRTNGKRNTTIHFILLENTLIYLFTHHYEYIYIRITCAATHSRRGVPDLHNESTRPVLSITQLSCYYRVLANHYQILFPKTYYLLLLQVFALSVSLSQPLNNIKER